MREKSWGDNPRYMLDSNLIRSKNVAVAEGDHNTFIFYKVVM